MTTEGRYGFWCFDCDAPALAADYREACAAAEAAGWRIIRGVNRCPSCAAADDRRTAAERALAERMARELDVHVDQAEAAVLRMEPANG